MAPRKPRQEEAAAEPPAADTTEHARLQEMAFDLGVLSRTRRLCPNPLPPTRLMQRADGKDIVKKSSMRKGRHLLVLNFQLAPAAAGKLGTLAALDSKNPVLYVEFPQGRYKLFGTLVFPTSKYLVLRLGQKEVLCEDVLESMIVFSEGWWVGTEEANPEEKRLPEPDWLTAPTVHGKADFSGRGAAVDKAGATQAEEEEGDEEEGDEAAAASQRPQRRASRAARGKKRLRYNEDSDGGGDEDEDDEDSDEEERAPRKLQRTGSQQQRAQRSSQAAQHPGSHAIDLAGSSDEDGQPLAARAKQATLDAFMAGTKEPAPPPKSAGGKGKAAAAAAAKPKSAAKPKAAAKKRAASSEEEEEDSDESDGIVDLAGSSDEDEEAGTDVPPSSARPRSQRKAAGAAAGKLRVADSDDSEEEEEEEDSGGGGSDDEIKEASDGGDSSEDDGSEDGGEEDDGDEEEAGSGAEGDDWQPSD